MAVDLRQPQAKGPGLPVNGRRIVGVDLFRDDGEGGHITAGGDRDADDCGVRLDHDMVAHLGFEDQGLPADKGVVADLGRPVYLRLMGQGHSFADID